jgi:hypothetical protein
MSSALSTRNAAQTPTLKLSSMHRNVEVVVKLHRLGALLLPKPSVRQVALTQPLPAITSCSHSPNPKALWEAAQRAAHVKYAVN